MIRDIEITRRNVLKGAAVGGASLLTGAYASAREPAPIAGDIPVSSAPTCYQTDGAFDPKAAVQAYHRLMEGFGYPISDVLRSDQFWACDFVQRDFARLGMGGVFWINQKGVYGKSGAGAYDGDFKERAFGYLGHDIYLLPGQMLPEHRHLGGTEDWGPKMESWLVRYGDVHLFGEYQYDEETPISELPPDQRPWGYGEDWFQCKYVTHRTAKSGKIYSLLDPESWHFMRAGKQGAIVTEFATYHNHVEFSKPGMIFDNSKAKG